MTHVVPGLVLSLYLNSRGLAFVAFEAALTPYDWAMKEVRGNSKERRVLLLAKKLLQKYRPSVLVLEDWRDEAYRRSARIIALYEAILRLAKKLLIPVIRYPIRKVREYFAYRSAFGKYGIACHIAKMMPALSYSLPRPRQPWQSEDPKQGLYDAAAVGLAYFGITGAQRVLK